MPLYSVQGFWAPVEPIGWCLKWTGLVGANFDNGENAQLQNKAS